MIYLKATGRKPSVAVTEPLTTGSVGIPVEVSLSAEYAGLECIVCFRTEYAEGEFTYGTDDAKVPPQCLSVAGAALEVGVYGALPDGTVVIPTIWTVVGTIREGATPSGVNPSEPAPSWVAQVQEMAETAMEKSKGVAGRVAALENTPLALNMVVDTVGIPAYVSDPTTYAAYGIAESGWYVFARISAPKGVAATAATAVEGAAGSIVTVGADHVDVAVRFEVAAQSCPVTVTWAAGNAETFVFRAEDLATRNLDYRTTFYVYDISPYVTWEYGEATGKYARNVTYFELVGGEYVAIDPTSYDLNADIPEGVYKHSKVVFEGMVRNVTYQLPEIVDCPLEFKLPDVPEDGYGAWYEVQLRYASTYSMTLTPESADVKAATDATQSQTGGVNIIDLHYADVAGAKLWRMVNTHSNYANAPKVESVAFRTPPTKVAYAAGEQLDMTGAVIVATYEDGTHAVISLDATDLTLSPANGATLAAGTTEVTATFSDHTATTPITVE